MDWWPYYEAELGARDVRPGTFRNYRATLKKFERFLVARGVGDVAAVAVTTEHVEAWRDHMWLVENLVPASINNRLRWVGTFYAWLVAEGVLVESPTLAVAYLRVRDTRLAPPVFDPAQVEALIAAARRNKSGRETFAAVRDEALLSFLADTGVRASECCGILLENVNLAARQALVHAEITKGRYDRTVTFGFRTAKRLSRYLREREGHAYAFAPELFVGRSGSLSYSGLYILVRRTGRAAGIINARPHLLRHTFAHDLKASGVSDEVIMSLGGWRSPTMLARYGRAEHAARAVEAYQRVGSPVDRASKRRT